MLYTLATSMLQIVAYINNEIWMKFSLLHVNNEIFKLLQSIFVQSFKVKSLFYLPAGVISVNICVVICSV